VKLSDHQVVRVLETNDELRKKMKPLSQNPAKTKPQTMKMML